MKSKQKINAKKLLMVAIFTATLFSNSASSVLANTITISQQAQKLAQTAQKQIPSADQIKDFHPLIFMDGKQVTFKNPIKNYADSTYLPFREVGSLIGASAQWSNEYRVAKFTKDNTTVEIINQTSASVVSNNNGRDNKVKEVTISNGKQSIPALNINGTTYVPLRYLSETFGMDIRYHTPHKQTKQNTITINEHDNLDYKQQKPQQQGVHPVNVGKLPTAPDGIDYNAKYLEYFEGNNFKGGKKFQLNPFNTFSIYVAGDFNLLFSQKSPLTGAKAIPGIWEDTAGGLVPIYDHNGDGLVGGKDPKSFNPADPKSYEELMDAAYAEREGILANGKRPHNYILDFYDAQIDKRFTNEPTWEESDGGKFHKAFIQERLNNERNYYKDPSINFYN